MRILSGVAALLTIVTIASSQTRIDVGTSVGFTSASASFRDLPGFPSCCPQFESGSGTGLGLGVGIDVPIAGSFFGSIRLGSNDRSHTMSTNELVDIIVGNRLVQSTVEHTFALPLTEYGVESHLGYRVGNFTVRAGVGYAYRIYGTARSREEIVDPAGVKFTDTRSAIRNERENAMPGAVTTAWNVMGVIGFDIPLKRGGAWRLVPEASLSASLTSVSSETAWSIVAPTIGMRLSYTLGHTATDATELKKESKRSTTTLIAATKPVASSTSPSNVYDVKLETDAKLQVRIEEMEEETYLPVLPYVFFERNSAVIPKRYATRITWQYAATTMSGLDLHRQMLNLLAERMKMYPDAKLMLTGTCAADEKDTSVAMRRAKAIASVLVDSFDIDGRRIATRARRLPLNPTIATGAESAQADDENRRVEVGSNESQLLMPYRVADTTLTMNPPSVTIRAKTVDGKPLDSWRVSVEGANVDSSAREGNVELVHQPTQAAARSAVDNAGMTITIEGRQSGTVVRDTLRLTVDALRLYDKRREMPNDSIVERFTLIVFPFKKSELTDAHEQILDFVRSRIGENARIIIEGSTDLLGSPDENLRLSLERAQAVARELRGNNTVRGLGEPDGAVSQMYPEERMLRRVVTITAYVPVRR